MFGMTTRSYVRQWYDLHLVDGVLYRTWRSKDELHQYEQLVASGDYQRALVQLLDEQGHFGVDRTCEQLLQREYYTYGRLQSDRAWMLCNCAHGFRGKP